MHMPPERRSPPLSAARPRISAIGVIAGLAVLGAVIGFTVTHLGEAQRFAMLLKQARPRWIAVALVFQLATYGCSGAIWRRVVMAAGYPLRFLHLARLAMEKLSVDQLVPAMGMAGNVVVVGSMRRFGIPPAVAIEALLIDIFSYYGAYAGVVSLAILVLVTRHDITPLILGLVAGFCIVVAAVPLGLRWLLQHRDWKPGQRLQRCNAVTRLCDALAQVSPERVRNPRLLVTAGALHVAIFALDAATLWAMMQAVGTPVSALTCFVALVVASLAGTLSLLPGGIGSFEAGCTATLSLLGVPIEAALTGTLLTRGLTLWLPLIPGAVLARRDLVPERERQDATASPDCALDELVARLGSSRTGLTGEEAGRRLAALGSGDLDTERPLSALGTLVRSSASPLSIILLLAGGASAVLGEEVNALIIATVVLLSAGVNAWQSARSQHAVRRLKAQVRLTATVLRDGTWTTILRRDVVAGDVIQLTAGDLVPADARLLESTDLHVQQAALTGEPLPAEKMARPGPLATTGPDAPELVYFGTSVVSGQATAIAFATGKRTQFGDIVRRLAARPEETEFERGTRKFSMLIMQTVMFLVLFILAVNLALHRDAFSSLLFAVALAVGLTPEFLPMITTVTLAQGAVQMAREKVIVKHLPAIQNLGSIDILCSDKTGTLTSGVMSLEASLDPFGAPDARALELGYVNSRLETGVKSALDAAILAGHTTDGQDYEKVGEIPFDFERRRLSVMVAGRGARSGEALVITKGAPESVLLCCTRYELAGVARDLDDPERARIDGTFRDLSARGIRVLAVAYRSLGPVADDRDRDVETDLIFAGFLTFTDHFLPGVRESLAALARDGVQVKILTGDNELTTRHLCDQVGLAAGRIVLGDEVRVLDESALARVAEEVQVFARVSPVQKHRIVQALKHHGHVVGFMGDGINDAPSLHGADVGISVAGAADVAREASDIVLLERRLDVMHAGIMAGRRAFGNVLKYLLMGTSSNFGNMLSMAGAVLFLPFLPMLPMQILVNNFLYDLAQITIPTDNVDMMYVRRPQRWDIGIIRRFMLLIGPVSSIFDFLTFFVLLKVFGFGESLFQTGWFVESLVTQVLVLFVIRTAARPWTSRPSVLLVCTACLVVFFGMLLPYTPLADLLQMQPLPPAFFGFVVVVVGVYLVAVELVKEKVLQRAMG